MYHYDVNILNNTNILRKDSYPDLTILKSEDSDFIKMLKEGKSPGIDNISSELIKHLGSSTNKILIIIYQTYRINKICPTHGQMDPIIGNTLSLRKET